MAEKKPAPLRWEGMGPPPMEYVLPTPWLPPRCVPSSLYLESMRKKFRKEKKIKADKWKTVVLWLRADKAKEREF